MARSMQRPNAHWTFFLEGNIMKWINVSNACAGSLDPPDNNADAVSTRETVLAANDNGPGGRRISLRCFQSVPILMDEVAVVDRLLQELPTAANDNAPVA